MSLENEAVSVTTTATALNSAESAGSSLVSLGLYNAGAVTVYLGGSTVATTTGVPLAAGGYADWSQSEAADRLYGRVASGTCEVRVVRTGVS